MKSRCPVSQQNQKMRMTVVPPKLPKLYELEVEDNLLTLKATFQRIT